MWRKKYAFHEYGMGKYDLKLLYNEKGPFVELHFFEEKKRKTW